jgi:hypoxanthine phosphoribosyltransferase
MTHKEHFYWSDLTDLSQWAIQDLENHLGECKRIHLIAVARGGWIPARLIGGLLERMGFSITYDSVSASSYSGTEQGDLTIDDSFTIPDTDVVVIVDDLVDSGATMESMQALAESKTDCEVLTCVLIHKQASTHTPDACGMVLDGGAWVVFPYELED